MGAEEKLKVISLGERSFSGKRWGVEDCLKDLLADKERLGDYNKVAILLLNDEGQYTTGFSQAGMSMSECVLLCEISKDMFKEGMA